MMDDRFYSGRAGARLEAVDGSGGEHIFEWGNQLCYDIHDVLAGGRYVRIYQRNIQGDNQGLCCFG